MFFGVVEHAVALAISKLDKSFPVDFGEEIPPEASTF
jgi:hypothetical protein